MRLICPECAAQYEIADGLIPPEGREVECSACGHGWRQSGLPPLRLSPEAAIAEDDGVSGDDGPPPPLGSRGLSDPVLAILREEAERELAARAAERTDALAVEPADTGGHGTWQAPAAAEERPGSGALPDPHALAASLQWEVPRRPDAEAPPPPAPDPAPRPRQTSFPETRFAQPRPAETEPEEAEPVRAEAAALALRQRRAHDRGFAVAVLCALLLVGAYAAAPSLAGRGAAGTQVAEARAAADRGRVWLQARAESLTDRAVTGVQRLFE